MFTQFYSLNERLFLNLFPVPFPGLRETNFFLKNLQFEAIYRILSGIVHTFFKESYDEILPAYYAWKVPEKEFKINWVMH
jgi:hypothetical protein